MSVFNMMHSQVARERHASKTHKALARLMEVDQDLDALADFDENEALYLREKFACQRELA